MKRKDNLTDLVERLPKETADVEKPPKSQEVVNSAGEIVLLGGKRKPRNTFDTNKSSLEPQRLKLLVMEALHQEIDRFLAKKEGPSENNPK